MYAIYDTPAIVLSARESGEANAVLTLYTRSLGVIRVHGQGLRYAKSKLRPSLPLFAEIVVALVRGREWWRLVDARVTAGNAGALADCTKAKSVGRAARLLVRLSDGEDTDDAPLFDLFASGFRFLSDTALSPEDIRNFETMLVLRILQRRGYLPDIPEVGRFADGDDWGEEEVHALEPARASAVSAINDALRGSGL